MPLPRVLVETDMTSYLKEGEENTTGDPPATGEDIANVAPFLASDWGNYITGQSIRRLRRIEYLTGQRTYFLSPV